MDCISFETRESSLSPLLLLTEEPHGATTPNGDASPRRRPRDPVERLRPAPDGRRAVAHPVAPPPPPPPTGTEPGGAAVPPHDADGGAARGPARGARRDAAAPEDVAPHGADGGAARDPARGARRYAAAPEDDQAKAPCSLGGVYESLLGMVNCATCAPRDKLREPRSFSMGQYTTLRELREQSKGRPLRQEVSKCEGKVQVAE